MENYFLIFRSGLKSVVGLQKTHIDITSPVEKFLCLQQYIPQLVTGDRKGFSLSYACSNTTR